MLQACLHRARERTPRSSACEAMQNDVRRAAEARSASIERVGASNLCWRQLCSRVE